MAKNDHCSICDYTENAGSSFAGVSPGRYGRVRRYGTDFLCDACIASVDQNLYDLVEAEEKKNENSDL